MGILDRISTVVKSNLNDVVSKAEDPEKILNQAITDMEADHKNAKRQIVESLAMQKQVETKLGRSREEAQKWEKKAMVALQAGDEALAREALVEKNKLDATVAEYEESVKTQSEYVGALKSSLAMLETKVEEAKQKRDELVKRFRSAEQAKKRAEQVAQTGQRSTDAVTGTSAFDNFDRMVDKIELLESHVEAQREIYGDDLKAAETDSKLEDLSVDAQLAALKEKQADPVDDQLAALKKKLQEG